MVRDRRRFEVVVFFLIYIYSKKKKSEEKIIRWIRQDKREFLSRVFSLCSLVSSVLTFSFVLLIEMLLCCSKALKHCMMFFFPPSAVARFAQSAVALAGPLRRSPTPCGWGWRGTEKRPVCKSRALARDRWAAMIYFIHGSAYLFFFAKPQMNNNYIVYLVLLKVIVFFVFEKHYFTVYYF